MNIVHEKQSRTKSRNLDDADRGGEKRKWTRYNSSSVFSVLSDREFSLIIRAKNARIFYYNTFFSLLFFFFFLSQQRKQKERKKKEKKITLRRRERSFKLWLSVHPPFPVSLRAWTDERRRRKRENERNLYTYIYI